WRAGGGGRRGPPPADLDLRRRLAVSFPDDPDALERQERIDRLERASVRDDQVRETARGDRLRLGAELFADPLDDPVHLTSKAVDQPRLQARRGVLRDHRLRLDEVDLEQSRRPGEEPPPPT